MSDNNRSYAFEPCVGRPTHGHVTTAANRWMSEGLFISTELS
jgi:hypothetical protein